MEEKKPLAEKPRSTREKKKKEEKVQFAKERKLFKKMGFSRQYRVFRKGGLSFLDAIFNTVYIFLSEKSVEKEKKRLAEEGKDVSSRYFLEHYSPLLRAFSSLAAKCFRIFVPKSKKVEKKGFVHAFHQKKYLSALLILLLAVGVGLYVGIILSFPLVLRAEIGGKVLGVVENQNVVESAINNLEDNVEIILGKSFRFPYEVNYTFRRQRTDTVKTKKEISDQLYTYVQDFICTAAGLYVDDVLVAVCSDEQVVEEGIATFLSQNCSGGEEGIYNEIRVVTQAYPTESLITSDQLAKLLEEMKKPLEDRVKNPLSESLVPVEENTVETDAVTAALLLSDTDYFAEEEKVISNYPQSTQKIKLDLYTTKEESYEAVLPYETEYRESADHYTSMADVTTKGKDGKARVTARIYYVDGKEIRREIASQEIIQAPVNRVVSVGTKVLPEDLGITSFEEKPGRFIVPFVGEVFSYFGGRGDGYHKGWDIPGDEGANIYASASGTVVVAIGQDGSFSELPDNHYTGYGYCVVLRHDDGYYTMYAHCSKINVTYGQEVKQGEKIAEIGCTGISEGNHVHFEILHGQTALDPARYLYQGNKTIR